MIDQKLISGIRKGNEADFKLLYDEYSIKILNVSMRFGLREEDAKEIVQEVFLRVWLKREHLEENLSLNAYLLTITKNLLIKRYRKQAYDITYKHYLKAANNFSSNNTEDDVIYTDSAKIAQKYIDKLPLQQKQIFLLSKRDSLSNKAISDKLAISIRTVENQLYRATKKIKLQLQDQDIIFILVLMGAYYFSTWYQ